MQALMEMESLMSGGFSFSGNERNCAFLNPGDNSASTAFADISAISGFNFPDDGRGLAYTDWDYDGDLDFWLSNRTAPAVRFLRNDLATENQFLMLRLHGNGKTCNKDAIGARVEVKTGDTKLMRTLKAGEGFLSQSSRWLHFGLGNSNSDVEVTVKWPDGTTQRWETVNVNQHLHLTQSEQAIQVQSKPETHKFSTKPYKNQPRTAAARLLLTSGVPLPAIKYIDKDGRQRFVREHLHDAPMLVNLWASWCAPCVKELAEFQDQNIPVLALAVNGLSPNDTSTRKQAVEFIEKQQAKYPWGFATAQGLSLMQSFANSATTYHQPLPAPTSFLLDGKGRVRVIYKGTVSAEQVKKDIEMSAREPEDTIADALPHPGRWDMKPSPLHVTNVANRMLGDGLIEEVFPYVLQFDKHRHVQLIPILRTTARRLREAGNDAHADKIDEVLEKWEESLRRKATKSQ